MVLLLSTALFLIPGFRDQTESKSEIDIQAAVKMPPLPGQSRSLLQFDGVNNDIADMNDFQETIETSVENQGPVNQDKTMIIKIEDVGERSEPPYGDHDYTYNYKMASPASSPGNVKVEAGAGSAWIDEDAPPMVSVSFSYKCQLTNASLINFLNISYELKWWCKNMKLGDENILSSYNYLLSV